jgi:hypothetical protein
VAENKKLRAGRGGEGSPDSADMIAAISLPDDLDKGAAEQPFVREVAGATVGVIFLEAGRLDESELTESISHPREPFTKVREESLGKRFLSHNEEIVATQRNQSNDATREAARNRESREGQGR